MRQGHSNPALPDRFVPAFAVFYILAYCLVPASMFAETLPLNLVTYNNDLFHYINVANYYLHLGPHNIDASFHGGEGYWVTPGVYHFLALFGALFGGNVVFGAMPLVYGSIALIGSAVVRLQREAFETPIWLAFVVAALLLSSVFFRIVYGSGFLAQYVASAVLLCGMVQSVRSVAEGRTSSWRGMIMLLLPYAFVEFYTYPPLFVVLLGIATTIICTAKVLGGAAARFSLVGCVLSAPRVLSWWLGIVMALVLAVSLFDPWRAWNIFFGYVPNLTTAHVGWVLDIIPVYALFGLPGPLQLTAWWYKFWIVAGVLLLAVNLYAYVLRPHAFATAARKSLVVLAAVAFAAYLGYFVLVWKSYQQWKFASYLPLLTLFVLYASTWRLVVTGSPPTTTTPRLLGGCAGALVLAALVANLTDPRALPTDVHRATALAQLRAINGIGGIDAVYVYMNDQGQTMLAPYFIDRLPLHFLSWSYYPIEDYDPDKINPRHPLFWQDAQCDGAADAIAFPEAGCLFRHAPVLPFDFTQTLGSEYHAVPGLQLEGVSGRETSGYWTDGDRAALTVYASPADVAARQVIWLNLRVQPIERDGWLDKIRALLSQLDLRVAATLRIGEHVAAWPVQHSRSWWISVPCQASDWTVTARAKLTLQMELHDPVVSVSGGPFNPYIRRLGWYISAVSLSRQPWGDAIEMSPGS